MINTSILGFNSFESKEFLEILFHLSKLIEEIENWYIPNFQETLNRMKIGRVELKDNDLIYSLSLNIDGTKTIEEINKEIEEQVKDPSLVKRALVSILIRNSFKKNKLKEKEIERENILFKYKISSILTDRIKHILQINDVRKLNWMEYNLNKEKEIELTNYKWYILKEYKLISLYQYYKKRFIKLLSKLPEKFHAYLFKELKGIINNKWIKQPDEYLDYKRNLLKPPQQMAISYLLSNETFHILVEKFSQINNLKNEDYSIQIVEYCEYIKDFIKLKSKSKFISLIQGVCFEIMEPYLEDKIENEKSTKTTKKLFMEDLKRLEKYIKLKFKDDPFVESFFGFRFYYHSIHDILSAKSKSKIEKIIKESRKTKNVSLEKLIEKEKKVLTKKQDEEIKQEIKKKQPKSLELKEPPKEMKISTEEEENILKELDPIELFEPEYYNRNYSPIDIEREWTINDSLILNETEERIKRNFIERTKKTEEMKLEKAKTFLRKQFSKPISNEEIERRKNWIKYSQNTNE